MGQDRLSFPGLWYEKGVDEDARFFHNMALNRPWKYTQKFQARSILSPRHDHSLQDDTTSDSEPEGPQDLRTLINRMAKHGSSQTVTRNISPKDVSGRSFRDSLKSSARSNRSKSSSPNNLGPNLGGGKVDYSPYNTIVSG